MASQIYKLSFAVCFYVSSIIDYYVTKLLKGPSPTEYIGGIVVNQSSKMAAKMIGSTVYHIGKALFD